MNSYSFLHSLVRLFFRHMSFHCSWFTFSNLIVRRISVRPFVRSSVHLSVRQFVRPSVRSTFLSPVRLSIHPSIEPCIHSLGRLLVLSINCFLASITHLYLFSNVLFSLFIHSVVHSFFHTSVHLSILPLIPIYYVHSVSGGAENNDTRYHAVWHRRCFDCPGRNQVLLFRPCSSLPGIYLGDCTRR